MDQSQVRFSVDDNNPRSTASRFENNQDMIFREATGEFYQHRNMVHLRQLTYPIIQRSQPRFCTVSDSTKQAVINQAGTMGISNLESGISINVQYQNTELIKDKESYQLRSTRNSINDYCLDEFSVFYAMQSLLQCLRPLSLRYTIPTMKVVDAPRFEYRGFHGGCRRSFHS
ncbi:hypothetical protein O9993_18720 [Vibrio lentus]|nr:hypothetical protein [Vibrio lentus]